MKARLSSRPKKLFDIEFINIAALWWWTVALLISTMSDDNLFGRSNVYKYFRAVFEERSWLLMIALVLIVQILATSRAGPIGRACALLLSSSLWLVFGSFFFAGSPWGTGSGLYFILSIANIWASYRLVFR